MPNPIPTWASHHFKGSQLTDKDFPGLQVAVRPLGKVIGHHGALQVPLLFLVGRHRVLVLQDKHTGLSQGAFIFNVTFIDVDFGFSVVLL